MKTPYPFQEIAIKRIMNATGYLLADDCGLGKTVSAIEAVKRGRSNIHSFRVLVVVPPKIVPQWVDAIREQDPESEILIIDRIPWNYDTFRGWAIMTYPELQHSISMTCTCSILWDWVIADEAHRIKNRTTLTAKEIKKIPKVRALALTATPSETTAADYWSILNFIRPDAFTVYWAFVTRHVIKKKGYQDHTILGGPKDLKDFGNLLAPHVLQRTRAEVLPDLPKMQVSDVRIDMMPTQAKHYKDLKEADDIIVEFEDGEKELFVANHLSAMTKAQQISTSPTLLGLKGYSGKLAWLDDWLSDHPNLPVVVFSRFRGVAIELTEKYKGDLVVGRRKGIGGIDFKEGKTHLLFGTIDAMGEGLNLQRARHAIFLDGHWSSRMMKQATDRIDRMDIKTSSNIYRLHSCREDRLIYKAVDEKWSEVDLIRQYLQTE